LPDAPDDRSSPGPLTLVLRAAFVPDGQEPPPEFSSVFNPLKFRATLDPATGVITCDNAGMSFLGDIRAEWHPDAGQGGDGEAELGGEGGDARASGEPDAGNDEPEGATQKPRRQGMWGGAEYRPLSMTYPRQSDGRTQFGLAGEASDDTSERGSPSSAAAPSRDATSQPDKGQGGVGGEKADGQGGTPANSDGDQLGGMRFGAGSVTRTIPSEQFARATVKTATDAGDPGKGTIGRPATSGSTGKPPAAATAKPGAANAPSDFNRFFDTLDKPLSDLAKELEVPEDYLLGHAAYESGYLGDHDFPLNNPFGYTKAGGRNLAFPSIADAVAAYRNDYAAQIKGATSAKDFIERIQGRLNGKPVAGWHKYNSQTKGYESNVLRVINSIPRHEADWRKQKEPAQ
jgi:hypothetical protein